MTNSVEELKAQIAALEAAEVEKQRELVKAYKAEYVYIVKWLDRFYVDVTRQLTEKSKAEFDNLKAICKNVSVFEPSVGGMTYLVAEGHLFSGGGGLHILRLGGRVAGGFGRETGLELSEEELRALKSGEVPPSLYYDYKFGE